MHTKKFNDGIMNIIKMHSYYFYIVQRNTDISCTCVTHSTSQASPECPKCLGTGFKITVRKIKGAAQDTMLPTTFRSDNFLVARNYFISDKYKMAEDDLIIDKDVIYRVFEAQELISLEGTIPYRKVSSIKKKFDSKVLLKNLQNIIDGGKNK